MNKNKHYSYAGLSCTRAQYTLRFTYQPMRKISNLKTFILKRNTKKQNVKATALREILLGSLLVCGLSSYSQVANKGNLYIADNATMNIGSSAYYFESGGSSQTSRTALTHGALAFNTNAAFNGASNSHYLDGYTRAIGSAAVILPIGQTNVYAPAKVLPSAAAIINAAYFRSAPSTVGSSIDNGITAISAVEYWDIQSDKTATISLTWSATSDLALLSGNTLSKLTIVGWNGTAWVEIPSVVDTTSVLGTTSTLTAGSITSEAPVTTSGYSAFSLGIKSQCASLIASSGNVKTYSGAGWSPSAPTITDPVVINSNYSAGSFSCNSLTINANVVLSNGQYIEVVNGVTGTGKITMASEASFIQRNPASLAPTIELTKITRPMRRWDYVLLSSPINNGTDFFNLLKNNNFVAAEVNGAANFGVYPQSAFGNINQFNAQGTGYETNTSSVTIGKGVNVFIKNQAPFSTSGATGSWNNQFFKIHMKIPGVANNGNVAVTVPASYNAMIGNPYPGAIDGKELLDAAGPNVRKTLYYWTFATPMTVLDGGFVYNSGDYATWTPAGGVAGANSPMVPNGSIASMQSVVVTAANATPTTFNITNCMREKVGNDQFFRSSASKDRFWLKLTGSANTQSEILMAYLPDATYGDDIDYDGKRFAGGHYTYLSSLIGNNIYTIQARPSFDDTDAVPLGIYKGAANESFTIGLSNKEGVFSDGQPIILHDKSLNIYHDLGTGDYAFTQPAAGIDNNRFEIVYRAPFLGTSDTNSNHVMASINNEVFMATALSPISSIQIFDMTGRKIQEFSANGQKSITVPFIHAQAVYITKIKLEDGSLATVKLINQ